MVNISMQLILENVQNSYKQITAVAKTNCFQSSVGFRRNKSVYYELMMFNNHNCRFSEVSWISWHENHAKYSNTALDVSRFLCVSRELCHARCPSKTEQDKTYYPPRLIDGKHKPWHREPYEQEPPSTILGGNVFLCSPFHHFLI